MNEQHTIRTRSWAKGSAAQANPYPGGARLLRHSERCQVGESKVKLPATIKHIAIYCAQPSRDLRSLIADVLAVHGANKRALIFCDRKASVEDTVCRPPASTSCSGVPVSTLVLCASSATTRQGSLRH
jgi:hypothetical protein